MEISDSADHRPNTQYCGVSYLTWQNVAENQNNDDEANSESINLAQQGKPMKSAGILQWKLALQW